MKRRQLGQGLAGLAVLALAAASTDVVGRAQDRAEATRLTWALYGEVNGRPSFLGREFRLGESRRVVIASDAGLMGSYYEAFPLRESPPAVQWSIVPPGQGVTISGDGVVTVAAGAKPGVFTVRADAPAESRTLELLVYDPDTSPLVGSWAEVAQIGCQDGREFPPAQRMRALVFRASGEFTAAWFPFESRVDYWGTYTHDGATGALRLAPDSRASETPSDLRPSGTATLDRDGRLVLKTLWLGTPRGGGPGRNPGPAAPSCGHVLQFSSRW